MNHSFEKPSNKIDHEFSNQPFDKMPQYFLDNGTDNDKKLKFLGREFFVKYFGATSVERSCGVQISFDFSERNSNVQRFCCCKVL